MFPIFEAESHTVNFDNFSPISCQILIILPSHQQSSPGRIKLSCFISCHFSRPFLAGFRLPAGRGIVRFTFLLRPVPCFRFAIAQTLMPTLDFQVCDLLLLLFSASFTTLSYSATESSFKYSMALTRLPH